jgi:lysophospholipase L1-like esterase
MIPAVPFLCGRLKLQMAILLLAAAAFCGCATKPATASRPQPAKPAFTIFLVGDSTLADKPLIPANPERGWGQILPMYFQDGVRVENHAVNGRSTKSFLDEGRWKPVVDRLKPADYVIIEFGHNDEKKTNPQRYTEPFGSFVTNLEMFVRETREHKATPILATPIARRKFDNHGNLVDTHGDYVKAMRQVAQEQQAPLLDLNRQSMELITRLGPESSKRLYDWIPAGEFERDPKGLSDDTHFNAYGASRMCDLAVGEIESNVPKLAAWLKRHSTADINQSGLEK